MSIELALGLLTRWARNAEQYWYAIPGEEALGCYGTGYNSWGVQTNQKYLAAMATLAMRGGGAEELDREWARSRALAALRFSLWSHLSGPGACTDGTQWGHTWISPLGVERMMHAVYLLEPELEDADREALRNMLCSESGWLLKDYHRGGEKGIFADPWNSSGKNHPESNIWNGALLWRTAQMYPDHSDAAAWRERAHVFLVNGVSVASDATDETVVDGKRVRERHVGAGFFPNYALDHHGYLNVGYMAICTSNAAMLHFDMELAGLAAPESLHHHQADLWAVLRRMVFSGGRLARIGGDTRVRYCYCQEYLLPSLLYAADNMGDRHALELAAEQLQLMASEAEHNADGSFYGKRLARLAGESPYYYTRLESDRACALSQYVTYAPMVSDPGKAEEDFEVSVAGSWSEPEHGAAFERSAHRLAAFSWRAHGLAQGTCQPPDDPHLSDWEGNLSGGVEFVSSQHAMHPRRVRDRRLLSCWQSTIPGGFVTVGSIMEGAEVVMSEGWSGADMAVHHLAFAALPDGRTVVGLELCRLGTSRGYVGAVKGMRFNLANDLYNDFERRLVTGRGEAVLKAPANEDGGMPLSSDWASVASKVGLVGIYGGEQLAVSRSSRRRGGAYQTLFVEEICWPLIDGPKWFESGAVLLDCGWAVLASANAEETRGAAGSKLTRRLEFDDPDLRGVSLPGADGKQYLVIANFGQAATEVRVDGLPAKSAFKLAPQRARVLTFD
jgi:hypothetical protein